MSWNYYAAAIVIATGLGYLLPGHDFQGLLREDEHRLDRVHAAVRAAEPPGALSKQRAFCDGGQRGGGGGRPDHPERFQGAC